MMSDDIKRAAASARTGMGTGPVTRIPANRSGIGSPGALAEPTGGD